MKLRNDTHLSDQQLLALKSGESPPEEAKSSVQHLAACEHCARTLKKVLASAAHRFEIDALLGTPELQTNLDAIAERYRVEHEHLGDEAMIARLLGQGSEQEVERIDRHLDTCSTCASTYDALVDSREQLVYVEGLLRDSQMQERLAAIERSHRDHHSIDPGVGSQLTQTFWLPYRRWVGFAAAVFIILGTVAAAAATYVKQRSEWGTQLASYEGELAFYKRRLATQETLRTALEEENTRSQREFQGRLRVLEEHELLAKQRLAAELERNHLLVQTLDEARSSGQSAALEELDAERQEDRRRYEEETRRLEATSQAQQEELSTLRDQLARFHGYGADAAPATAATSLINRLPLNSDKKKALLELDPDARAYIVATLQNTFGDSLADETTLRSLLVEIPGWLETFQRSREY